MGKNMKTPENRTYDIEIIAGKCGFNLNHLDEEYKMAEIQVSNGKGGMMQALSAERCVGAKSRTKLALTPEGKGKGMGVDFDFIWAELHDGPTDELPPSVRWAKEFVKETGIGIAAEIMIPHLQLPHYEKAIPKGMFFPWNPSNDQLAWHIAEIAIAAQRNRWAIGLKNGKWLGSPYGDAIRPGNEKMTSMESTWHGLYSYASPFLSDENIVFIHRGVDIPEKEDNRNAVVDEAVQRIAKNLPKVKRGLDLSHSLGENKRHLIVENMIEAMKMTVHNSNEYLYQFILIEVGTSETDTKQHISVDELRDLVREISKFRRLRGPLVPTD